MADNGEQQPSGPPEYKVYRSRKGRLSGLRSPDLSGLRERTPRAPKWWRRDREPKPERTGPPRRWTAKRVLKWVGIAALFLVQVPPVEIEPARVPALLGFRHAVAD